MMRSIAIACSLRYTAKSSILVDSSAADIPNVGFVSDSSWRCTSVEPEANWYIPEYDDSKWPYAVVTADEDVEFSDR